MREDSIPSQESAASASRSSSSSSASSSFDGNTTQAGRRRKKPLGTQSTKRQLPEPGEELFGFRLRHELGKGAFARVYLAEQADLAGRPVVLKVSDISGDEPQTLAQLQHTHIVPIYSVHEHERRNLRAVCMPYFGGSSLSQVLEKLWAQTKRPTGGAELVRALEAAALPAAPVEPSRQLDGPKPHLPGGSDPSRLEYLCGETYLRASVWLIARIAEGLAHAHQRGVIHRDIKPSNILLTADGIPMLLDFNVSQSALQDETAAVLGGTVAYMAPEHLRAMAGGDEDVGPKVDHRADIYSLGMVLYEMMVGARPFAQTGSYSPVLSALHAMAIERATTIPSLRGHRPDVPWGIESVLRRCLAPNPRDRYQSAEEVAEDLRRFLADLPLKYAPELSVRERVQKWLRRHPRVASSGTVAFASGVLLIAGAASLVAVKEHLQRTREQLAVAESQERQREYRAGTVRALTLINTTTEVEDHLKQGIEVCETTLGLYDVLDRDDWQAAAAWRDLDAEAKERLGEDTRELLLLLAWARVRTAPGDATVLHQALALVDKAGAVGGLPPSRAVGEARAAYLTSLKEDDAAAEARRLAAVIEPKSARDHYLLATTFARGGRHLEAIAHLNTALALDPQHYWSLLQRGICYQELGKFTLAAGDFGACVGVAPDWAWGYFNRGYVLDQSGSKAEAIQDYTAALACDPDFILAYMNRGLARLEVKAFAPALADFDAAAKHGRDDARLHLGRGVALEGLGRHQDADAAFAVAFTKAKSVQPELRQRFGWVYGMAVSRRLPDKALEAFDQVLAKQPRQPQALYGRAMVLVEQGREAEGLKAMDRVVAASPNFAQARRYRAVLQARGGHFNQAMDEINWCLEREPDVGATHYAAACVAALAAGKATTGEAREQITQQALTFLDKALSLGYGRAQAASDPDLKAIRPDPRFAPLLKGPAGR